MRHATVETIYKAALKNKSIYFITGDMGHYGEKEFQQNIPHQYINAGVTEQNIIGIAAGLALSGAKVFVYSITPFITMRCFEQIKVDVCYQNLDVTIIGIGGGFSYGYFGNTHCSIEDIAIMRVLPNMKILCPANPTETEQATQMALSMKGPTYIRIGRGKEPNPTKKYSIFFGKSYIAKPGKDITIFSTGAILDEVVQAALLLSKKGIDAEVVHMSTIKPFDTKTVLKKIRNRRAIFSVEEHSIIGGLGSAVAEVVSEQRAHVSLKRLGVKDVYLKTIGSQAYLRDQHGISSRKIVATIIKHLKSL